MSTSRFGSEIATAERLESLRVAADLAPDVCAECLRILTWNRHGRVDGCRMFGTLRDGGPFEIVFVRVLRTGGDHIRRYEIFDVADDDAALARFAELCAKEKAGDR